MTPRLIKPRWPPIGELSVPCPSPFAIGTLALSLSVLLAGCSKEVVAPTAQPSAQSLQIASPNPPSASEPESVQVQAQPAPANASSDSLAQELSRAPSPPSAKFQAYTEAYRAVRQAPAPQIFTGSVPDPGAISDSLGQLGARVQRLAREQDALEQTLSPAEKSQWKSFRESLSQGSGE